MLIGRERCLSSHIVIARKLCRIPHESQQVNTCIVCQKKKKKKKKNKKKKKKNKKKKKKKKKNHPVMGD